MTTLILSRHLLCMFTVFMLNKHCLSLNLSHILVNNDPVRLELIPRSLASVNSLAPGKFELNFRHVIFK